MENRKIRSVADLSLSGDSAPHLTSKVLMIRPIRFGYNEETASNNAFQKKGNEGHDSVQKAALAEFNSFVALLESNGVEVVVVEDTPNPHTPDSIFPNNWFSTHTTGEIVLYPMCASNRRLERKEAPLAVIKSLRVNGAMGRTLDLSICEADNRFLEGTGSMVLDRTNAIAFVCRSPRSDESVLDRFCKDLGYKYFFFNAYDRNGSAIYHTNVMMCMGDKFVVACLDSIRDSAEREIFVEISKKLNKEIVDISIDQMENFAGNMLQLKNSEDESIIVMSSTAKKSLNSGQLNILESHCKIISPQISTIETNGGGSARCMIAELF
ncbi:MAG: arginine deiminase-related protein [Holophagaceae bacterium]|nr:arginine deiminase-related protein [Holophagaceae bacterium]